jgi:hypothetical protein
MSRDVMFLEWIQMGLSPAGYYARRIPVEASLKLPDGFDFGTRSADGTSGGGAGPVRPHRSGNLPVDSPVYAGRHAKHIMTLILAQRYRCA